MRSDSEMVNLLSVVETLCYMVDEDSDGVEEVMQLPSIDLVTCLKCKWCAEDDYKLKCWNIKGLNKTDGVVNPDDFCSYGERKENE